MANTNSNPGEDASPMNTTPRSWDAYVEEATQAPFLLQVSEDRIIEVHAPTGGQIMYAQRHASEGDVELQLRAVVGDAAEELMPLLETAPAGVIARLLEDIIDHFDLADEAKQAARMPQDYKRKGR